MPSLGGGTSPAAEEVDEDANAGSPVNEQRQVGREVESRKMSAVPAVQRLEGGRYESSTRTLAPDLNCWRWDKSSRDVAGPQTGRGEPGFRVRGVARKRSGRDRAGCNCAGGRAASREAAGEADRQAEAGFNRGFRRQLSRYLVSKSTSARSCGLADARLVSMR